MKTVRKWSLSSVVADLTFMIGRWIFSPEREYLPTMKYKYVNFGGWEERPDDQDVDKYKSLQLLRMIVIELELLLFTCSEE